MDLSKTDILKCRIQQVRHLTCALHMKVTGKRTNSPQPGIQEPPTCCCLLWVVSRQAKNNNKSTHRDCQKQPHRVYRATNTDCKGNASLDAYRLRGSEQHLQSRHKCCSCSSYFHPWSPVSWSSTWIAKKLHAETHRQAHKIQLQYKRKRQDDQLVSGPDGCCRPSAGLREWL